MQLFSLSCSSVAWIDPSGRWQSNRFSSAGQCSRRIEDDRMSSKIMESGRKVISLFTAALYQRSIFCLCLTFEYCSQFAVCAVASVAIAAKFYEENTILVRYLKISQCFSLGIQCGKGAIAVLEEWVLLFLFGGVLVVEEVIIVGIRWQMQLFGPNGLRVYWFLKWGLRSKRPVSCARSVIPMFTLSWKRSRFWYWISLLRFWKIICVIVKVQ